MKCNKFRKLLIPYSEGSLSDDRAMPLERHLAECDSCARELQAITCTVDVLKKVEYPVFEPAVDLRSRVLAQITEEKPVRRSWWQPSRMPAYSAAMAGLLLVAIAGASMWRMMERGVEVTAPSVAVERQYSKKVEHPKRSTVAARPAESHGMRLPTKVPKARGTSTRTTLPMDQYLYGSIRMSPSAKPLNKGLPARSPSANPDYYFKRGAGNRWEWDTVPAPSSSVASARSLGYGVKAGTDSDTAAGRIVGDAKAAGRPRAEEITRSMAQAAPGGTQAPGQSGYAYQDENAPPAPVASRGVVEETTAADRVLGVPLAKSAELHDTTMDFGNFDGSFMSLDGTVGMGNSSVSMGTILDKDIEGLEVKLRNFPSSVKIIGDLMERYRQAGRPRDEYNMAQRLTKLDPDNAGYWLSRAQAADRVPMPRTAEVCYERAIKLGLKDNQLAVARGRVKVLEAKHK